MVRKFSYITWQCYSDTLQSNAKLVISDYTTQCKVQMLYTSIPPEKLVKMLLRIVALIFDLSVLYNYSSVLKLSIITSEKTGKEGKRGIASLSIYCLW
jgi:hypothetical protein